MPPNRLGGPARLVMAATVASVVTGLLLAAPAAGTENKNDFLQLSNDGMNYNTTLAPTLFRSTNAYVPGESRRDTIWVRNGGRDTAHFSFGVRSTGQATGDTLPGYMRLQASAPGHEEALAALPSKRGCTPVVNGWTLAAGHVLLLTLDLDLALQAPNSTRKQDSTFDLVFVLQGIDGGQPVSPCTALPMATLESASIGILPVAGGTAEANSKLPNLLTDAETGALIHDAESGMVASYAATDHGRAPRLRANSRDAWLVAELPHSNVVANSRSPWPWLLTLSASAYVLISLRRRRRTQ
ncbi:hypothetical protein [Arthrobacter sp. H35-D1]|uniref:hypothetical protein n=1 Tax=Arthrobacter sp. H35-D1 TaxID=3046202 RepID=UPI0024BB6720|nr:hypothetical protein [Arthrobacter sp. H35-D1]MDJ0314002.1 hypothetical protein [Arthrobacter sp. H35-D1]